MDNKNPAPEGGRASRVSFPNWTPEAHTLSAYRAQYLMSKYGFRPEIATTLGSALFGEHRHG
jgi:hypothetical protein